MKARAAIADGRGGLALEEIEVGNPILDEVLVEIKAAGVCHTDCASLNWQRPLVMGHEGAGIVRSVGPLVRHVRPGDRVLLNWVIPCGECSPCVRLDQVLCERTKPGHVLERSEAHAHAAGTLWKGEPIDRSFNIGTLSSLTLVRAAAVTPLPAAIPWQAACIVGCAVMTGFGTVKNVAQVKPGSSMAVLGCGGVGLNMIQTGKLCGAGKIIALDRQEARLAQARQFGATDVVNVAPEDLDLKYAIEEFLVINEGKKADYAFEATGVPALAFTPLRMVRDGGMALQVSGINETISARMPEFMWNKVYMAPLYGGCVPDRDFPRIFDHYLHGELKLEELISRTYHLDELQTALDDMLKGQNAKGVIVFEETCM